jgi:flagellar basal-body rod protein FlgB
MEMFNLVEKALNIRAFYHKILAGNIANVETPNYKEKDIDFNQALESRITNAQDIKVLERAEYDGLNSSDGNTVNMENQIVKLTENNLYFNSLVRVISKRFASMRYAISEGKG